MLRLLHNRHLQWRFMNARATAATRIQRIVVEKKLFTAWTITSGLRDSVVNKRIKQQLLTQDLKLTTLLKGQMGYLDEWSLMEKDHLSSLLGSNEALKASILRLPVVDGARADLQEVKDTVCSTVDVMKAMGSSICSLLSKVEGTSSLVSELAKVAAQEQSLLDQARALLCKVAEMHVLQCSLQGHIVQLNRSHSQMHL